MNSLPKLRLDWCSHEAAKYAVEHWHYSKSLPAGKSVKVGVWESGLFIGAVVFSMGANKGLGNPYGLTMFQCCELVRVALNSHKNAVTRIVSIAFKFLKKSCPELRLCVSFADPEHGHIGTIYQGGGWIYTGKSAPADEYFYKGKRIHGRQARSLGLHRNGILKTLKKIMGSSKLRYLMPLDSETRRRILPLSKPYPKRAGSDTLDTPSDQLGEGGSLPTPALHSS